MKQKIDFIKTNKVDDFYLQLTNPKRVDNYKKNRIDFLSHGDIIKIEFDIKASLPELDPDQKLDADNAIKLYECFGNLGIDLMVDPRFWTSLSHINYKDYVYERWLKSRIEESSDKIIRAIQVRYFTKFFGSDRALVRHALSRLWFGAYLTTNNGSDELKYYFDDEKDQYLYTKMLYKWQQIQFDFLERSMGRDKKILLSVLHFFSKYQDKLNNKIISTFAKRLCLISQHTKLTVLDPEDIFEYYKKDLSKGLNLN
tara:strand:- start:337 stop:1104 length:768 start_codon:yes stop_codon:yes gene_type:complete